MDVSDKLKSLSIDRSAPLPRRGGGKLPAIVGGVVVAAIIAWLLLSRGEKPGSEPSPAANVASAPGVLSGVDTTARPRGGLVASGYVVARRSATVSVDITGRLTDVLFEEGAVVEKGQVLARLDDDLARYDLQLARGRLQAARAAIASIEAQKVEAIAQRKRADDLASSGAISRAALEAAVSRAESLEAQYGSAVADARVAEIAVGRQAEFVERHIVRAPFSGVIIAKNAQAGEILSPAAGGGEFTRTGVATLVDMASLEVEVDVNEGQISEVKPGQAAKIVLDAYPDREVGGEVIAIIPTANRDRATIQVRVGFKNRDDRILPQMAAKVTFDRSSN